MEQPWTTVQRRKKAEWICQVCEEKFSSREEKHKHIEKKHDNGSKQPMNQKDQTMRRKDIECKRGKSCFRLANGTCWFKHSSVTKSSPQREQRFSPVSELWCQFQENCSRNDCKFKHFEQGFQKKNLPRDRH